MDEVKAHTSQKNLLLLLLCISHIFKHLFSKLTKPCPPFES